MSVCRQELGIQPLNPPDNSNPAYAVKNTRNSYTAYTRVYPPIHPCATV